MKQMMMADLNIARLPPHSDFIAHRQVIENLLVEGNVKGSTHVPGQCIEAGESTTLINIKKLLMMNKNDIMNHNTTEVLLNQQEITIRAVRPDDKVLVIRVLANLNADSIYRRFF